MIDLDELHDKMVSYILVGFSNSGLSPKDAIEILNRLRQAEKDAARYRWLRDVGCFKRSADDFFWVDTAQSDLAIDEAMQCSGGNK